MRIFKNSPTGYHVMADWLLFSLTQSYYTKYHADGFKFKVKIFISGRAEPVERVAMHGS